MALDKSAWTVTAAHNHDDITKMLRRLAAACRDNETSSAAYHAAVRHVLKAAKTQRPNEYESLVAQALENAKILKFDPVASRIAYGLEDTAAGLAKTTAKFAASRTHDVRVVAQRSSALLSQSERIIPRKTLRHGFAGLLMGVASAKLRHHLRAEVKSVLQPGEMHPVDAYIAQNGLERHWQNLNNAQKLRHITEMMQSFANRTGMGIEVKPLQLNIGKSPAGYHGNGRFSVAEKFLSHAALEDIKRVVRHECDHIRQDQQWEKKDLQFFKMTSKGISAEYGWLAYLLHPAEVVARMAEKTVSARAAVSAPKWGWLGQAKAAFSTARNRNVAQPI